MVHFTIKQEEGKIVARDDKGAKFRNGKVSEYDSVRGIKIALTKFGNKTGERVEFTCEVPEESARKPMATTPAVHPSGKTRNLHRSVPPVPPSHRVLFTSLSLGDIETLYEQGMALVKAEPKVTKTRGKNAGKSTLDWSAGDVAVAHVVDNDGKVFNFGRLCKCRKGARWAAKSPKEQAELIVKQEAFKAKRAEKAAQEATLEERQVLNTMARSFGFPRFRELAHKAELGDAKAIKIVDHIQAQVNAANDLKTVLTVEEMKAKPFAVFGQKAS